MNRIKLYLWLLIGAMSTWNCSDDDELPFDGSDNSITSFALTTSAGVRYTGEIVGNKIIVTAPLNVSLSGSQVFFSLCEQATVAPDPATVTDWDSEQTFTVTAYNQQTKQYAYQVKRTQVYSEGEIVLRTQADVAALAASGVTIIDGDLIIGENTLKEGIDTIKDLSALSKLVEVKANIIINNSFAGTDLNGLKNIRSAAGLYIGNSSSALNCLNEINVELPALKNLGQLVVNSTKVKTLKLPVLQETGWLYLNANNLAEVDFSALESCITNFSVKASSSNTALETMAFPKLQLVGGVFSLQNYTGVKEVTFPKLASVDGSITVKSMTALQALDFPELQEVDGAISVDYVHALTAFRMPRLEACSGAFNLNLNAWGATGVFTALDLTALKSVEGQFQLYGNDLDEMETLAFPALERVAGTFSVLYCKGSELLLPKLADCENVNLFGFPNVKVLDLSAVTGLKTLRVSGFPALEELKSVAVLENFTLGANLKTSAVKEMKLTNLQEVTGTFQLENFEHADNAVYAVRGLKKIGSISSMGGNSAFRDLSYPDLEEVGSAAFTMHQLLYLRMPKLKTVREKFSFQSLRDLISVDLPVLTKVGENFTLTGIWDNTATLTTIALPALTEVGGVTINTLPEFEDFSAFKNAVGTLEASNWKVSGCGYNPTLEDMKAGKYNSEK